ncbi:MAG: HAMP domain-containing sensor histidine kinase [Thaumarchaeota archaeon]|nr:HAMP domain-containing sensor histidine kinase [Nitrososphaerota archaeon]
MIDFIQRSITRKTILILLAMTLVPIIIVSLINNQMSEQMRSDFLNELEQQFYEKNLRLQGSIEQRIFEMDVLSHHVLFQELTTDLPNVQVQDLNQELKTRYLDYAERTLYVDTILEVKVLDNDGIEQFSLYNTHLGDDYTLESLDKITDIQITFDFDETLGRIVKAEAPVMSKDGSQKIGTLLFVTDMRNFDPILLDRSGLRETGEAYFVNTEKIMASESRFIENAAYNQQVDTLGVRECLENNSEVRGEIYLDYRGEPIIGYSKCMLENGVVLLVEADVNELTSSLDKFQDQFLIVLFSTAVIAIFVSFVVGRWISNPVKKLSHLACEIANKNFDAKLNIKRKDEIGELASVMNSIGQKLKAAEQQKNEFAAMITHELRTPMVPIKGYCEILKNPKMGELNQRQRHAVDEILNNSKQLLQLIQNVLNAQKLEAHGMTYNIETISVDELIENVMETLTHYTTDKKIKFTESVENGLYLRGDKSKLMEIFNNLVANAVDFVPENTGKIEIGVECSRNDVVFSVKDNGMGIPKDKQKNLFKRFYQADTSLARKHGGSGLGLAICKGYVEDLSGKMWLKSEEGKGTTFFFTLPKESKVKSK